MVGSIPAVSDDVRRIPITDDHMFGYAMRQEDICIRVIKCLLPDVPIADVRFSDNPGIRPEMQKTIEGNLGYHAVRLDVYLDDGKTVINVEMQTGNKKNLPKRVRYYGSMLDHDQLERSKDYELLKPTYVIFICTYDPFERGQYCYWYENRDQEGNSLNDGSYKLFFNPQGHKGTISEELKDLLTYFKDPEHAAQTTELIRDIDQIVDKANRNADWRREHMMYELLELDAEKRGEAIGEAKGRAKGRAEGRAEGTTLMAKLATLLAKDGRIDDIGRAGIDEAFREAKLKEYGLT